MLRVSLLASAALVFTAAAAGATPAYMLVNNGRNVMVAPVDQPDVRGPVAKSHGAIVNEFASKYPNGLYWCCFGIPIAGPSSHLGSFSSAVAFTPAVTKKATEITVGVGYVSGTNSITVALYSDNGGGLPGTELASGTVGNFPVFGSCCGTGTVTIPATKLIAGTQYWVVFSASGNTFESTVSATTDQVNQHSVADNINNGGWYSYPSIEYPVVEVK